MKRLATLVLAGLCSFGCSTHSSRTLPARSFTCNYVLDRNANKVIEPGEIIGIKSHFKSNEFITFVRVDFNSQGDNLSTRVYSPSGKLVYTQEHQIPYSRNIFHVQLNARDLVEKGGQGTYTVQYLINNKPVDTGNLHIHH